MRRADEHPAEAARRRLRLEQSAAARPARGALRRDRSDRPRPSAADRRARAAPAPASAARAATSASKRSSHSPHNASRGQAASVSMIGSANARRCSSCSRTRVIALEPGFSAALVEQRLLLLPLELSRLARRAGAASARRPGRSPRLRRAASPSATAPAACRRPPRSCIRRGVVLGADVSSSDSSSAVDARSDGFVLRRGPCRLSSLVGSDGTWPSDRYSANRAADSARRHTRAARGTHGRPDAAAGCRGRTTPALPRGVNACSSRPK